jgi:glycosyltransferase involved in cell wall biosynthesis
VSIVYRGIWPHQWGKWLFPERIEKNTVVQRLLQNPVVKLLQRFSRWVYDSFAVVRVLSSYNVIVVAKRRPLLIALDARHAESAGGGIKTYLEVLVRAIVKHNDTPLLISTKPLAFTHPAARALVVPLKVHWWIWEQLHLPRALQRARADFYHAVANGGVPIISSTPTVLTVQDLIPLQDQHFFAHSRLPIVALLSYALRIKLAVSRAKKIICTNIDTAQFLQDNFVVNTCRLSTIPLGVDHAFFTPLSTAPQKKPYILYHGGIAERKNIEVLLSGFALYVKTASAPPQLYITGENPDLLYRIKVLAKELHIAEKITWLGWVSSEKLTLLVQNASIIVYPSKHEGFGLPILEGMLAGKPVVASNLQLFRRLAKTIPFFFDPDKPEELSQALQLATVSVSRKRLLLGQLLAKRYTWQRTIDATYAQYTQVLAKKSQ